ncbi:hypothetical protein ElyMa_004061800 [Elysia marginata]|uniref:Transmembrane protein 177 n=1 Tax=Elysia marginata TaxID=1093978 RepID=A0AAV4G5X6_9GAST|nr:hypothetical protein ElyMa_004061800 [Elysia marginata]
MYLFLTRGVGAVVETFSTRTVSHSAYVKIGKAIKETKKIMKPVSKNRPTDDPVMLTRWLLKLCNIPSESPAIAHCTREWFANLNASQCPDRETRVFRGMDNLLKRVPLGVQSDTDTGDLGGKEYMRYKRQTRGEYEDLMMEFDFRCRRAAMMNYYEASGYEKNIYRLEIVAALLGTISISAVTAWCLPKSSWLTSPSFENLSQMSTMGIVGMTGAGLVYFLSKGSSRVIPSLSRRAELNIEAAAAWQRLAQTTRSFRIRLDNPKLDVPDYATWYEQLITEREKLCVKVSIPQATYERFNDPKLVYSIMKQRRHMFLQYLDLETSDLDDFKVKVKNETKDEPQTSNGLTI